MRIGRIALLICAASLIPDVVWGKCAGTYPFFSPHSGAKLPVDPTVYLFLPRGEDVALLPPQERMIRKAFGAGRLTDDEPSPVVLIQNEKGNRVDFELVEIGGTPAYDAFALKIKTKGSLRVDVRAGRGKNKRLHANGEYGIDPLWTRPAATLVAVTRVEESAYGWSCSYERARVLTPSLDAPAYRVEWAYSRKEYDAKMRHVLVAPRTTDHFFWRQRSFARPVRIRLGYLNCIGRTFDWDEKPIFVNLVALFPDGTKTKGGGKLVVVKPIDIRPVAPH